MTRRFFSISQTLVFVIFLAISTLFTGRNITSVLAYSTDRSITSPCTGDVQAPDAKSNPFLAQIMEPGEAPLDANWPVIHEETKVEKDASGQDVVTTTTVRQNPHPKPPKTTDAVSPLRAMVCDYEADRSYSKSTQLAGGGITQNVKNYTWRYVFHDGNFAYWSYYTYRTEVSWTRIDNTYTLGKNTTTLKFIGVDCAQNGQQYEATGTASPTFNGNSTPIYYWTFMNQWNTLSPGSDAEMITTYSTPAFKSGVSVENIVSVIQYRKTGP